MAVPDVGNSFGETSELAAEYVEYGRARTFQLRHARYWLARADLLSNALEDLLERDVERLPVGHPLLCELGKLCDASAVRFFPTRFREVKRALDAVLDEDGIVHVFMTRVSHLCGPRKGDSEEEDERG